mmetsp:Transcript_27899/g.38570  ORF Transcript_27899/g.38570 Transcript_27899/m.38570 type:complete len:137 (-) Transcript_27899:107-517(-)
MTNDVFLGTDLGYRNNVLPGFVNAMNSAPGPSKQHPIDAPEPVVGKKTKVEVCMGGACRKRGASQLVEACMPFATTNVSVSCAKCMGKCGKGSVMRLTAEGKRKEVLTHVEYDALDEIFEEVREGMYAQVHFDALV